MFKLITIKAKKKKDVEKAKLLENVVNWWIKNDCHPIARIIREANKK